MLYQIKNASQLTKLEKELPFHIYQETERIINILEDCHQMTGEYNGNIYILTNESELAEITNQYPYLNLADYEFMDVIESARQMTQASLLYILGATDTLSIIMPIEQLPQIIKQEKEQRKEG